MHPTVCGTLSILLVKRDLYRLNETLTVVAAEEFSNIEGLTGEIRVTYIPHVTT